MNGIFIKSDGTSFNMMIPAHSAIYHIPDHDTHKMTKYRQCAITVKDKEVFIYIEE